MKKLLVGLCAIFICTFAIAHTIEWYVDDSLYQTTTCNAGDSVTPPTVPEKYGYHFVKWYEGYIQLEYIESTGTQYIDTGVSATYGDRYVVKAAFTSFFAADQSLIGALTTGNGVYFGVNSDNQLFLRAVMQTEVASGSTASVNTIYTYDLSLNKGKSVCIVTNDSGIVVNSLQTSSSTPPTNNKLYLFATNLDRTKMRPAMAKIYYAQIYGPGGALVRNFIPAKRNSDNSVGMYDTVSEMFFTNAGTGEFIAGPEVGEL